MLIDLFFVSTKQQRQTELVFLLTLFLLVSHTKVCSLYSNQVSLSFCFPSDHCWQKNCLLSLCTVPYMHDNSCIFISNSNIKSQTCTCKWLTLQMTASMKDLWSSAFFLLQVNKSWYNLLYINTMLPTYLPCYQWTYCMFQKRRKSCTFINKERIINSIPPIQPLPFNIPLTARYSILKTAPATTQNVLLTISLIFLSDQYIAFPLSGNTIYNNRIRNEVHHFNYIT